MPGNSAPFPSDLLSSIKDFDQLLASEHLPPGGPALYEARRQLWLTPRPTRTTPNPNSNPERRQRLETYLATPGVAESDDEWRVVRGLWKGICSGKRLSDRIPLRSMVRNQTSSAIYYNNAIQRLPSCKQHGFKTKHGPRMQWCSLQTSQRRNSRSQLLWSAIVRYLQNQARDGGET